MIKTLLILLFGFTLIFSSCEKNDPVENNTEEVANLSGESFKKLTTTENVAAVVMVETITNEPDRYHFFPYYSFPGNNYVRVWNTYGSANNIWGETNFNLERLIWYKIDNYEYQNMEYKTLYLAY